MALTLIKEDGSIVDNANSYADVAEGDAYHEGHLYSDDWDGATTANKEAALVMATRIIDHQVVFRGCKVSTDQKLQWPRVWVPDPDAPCNSPELLNPRITVQYFASDVIPKGLKDATIELARELMKQDRLPSNPTGEGIQSFEVFQAVKIVFDKKDRLPVMPSFVSQMLSRFGNVAGVHGGVVKLTRV